MSDQPLSCDAAKAYTGPIVVTIVLTVTLDKGIHGHLGSELE